MTSFSDDFNRADGAVGANWVQVSGTWTVASNQLSPGTSGSTVVLRAVTAMATNDNFAQITIAATTPVSQGVFCRGDSTLANGYVLRNDGTTWAIFKVVSSAFTSIGTFTAAAVAGDIAKIQAVGSTITGTISGVARITLTDTAVTSGTSVGLRSMSTSGLRYDNFVSADVGASYTGDAALASTATLTADGTRATTGTAALAATAALTAAGVRSTQADTATTVTAALTAAGQTAAVGNTTLGVTAALTADGQRTTVADASLNATVGLTAQGQAGYSGDTSLAATVTLTAAGTTVPQPSSAQLDATATLSATGTTTAARGAALAATATLTASGTTTSVHGGVIFTIGPAADRWTARQPGPRWSAAG